MLSSNLRYWVQQCDRSVLTLLTQIMQREVNAYIPGIGSVDGLLMSSTQTVISLLAP